MECFNIMEGTSLVRIFHASPNAPAVDVYVDNKLVAENLQFTQFTDYMPVAVGQHMVDIYAAGTRENPVIAVVLKVPNKEILTVAATGDVNDLELIVLEDNSKDGITEGSSTVRAVHLAPNAPGVDIKANDMTLANDLKFREMTDYVVVPPGTYRINVTAHGSNDSVLMFNILLEANTISTVYVCGDLSNLQPFHVLDGGTYICK